MDLHQIECFLRVADLQHLTRAAESLHIAQPALSRTIKNLEADVGIALFDRSNNRIKLTEAGNIFYNYASNINKSVKGAYEELESFKKTQSATIRINMAVGLTNTNNYLMEFQQKYPDVKLKLWNSPLGSQDDEFADFTLYASLKENHAPNNKSILKERIMLGISHDHKFAANDRIRLYDCRNEDFIISLPENSMLNDFMNLQCRINGFYPNVRLQFSNFYGVADAIAKNLGIAFVPELSWYYLSGLNNYKLLDIYDTKCERYINIRWKSEQKVSKMSVLLRDYLTSRIHEDTYRIASENGMNPEDFII